LIQLQPARLSDLPRILRLRHEGFSVHAPKAYTAEVQNLLQDVDPAELETMIEHQQLFVACPARRR
jgi:hypothetical protein